MHKSLRSLALVATLTFAAVPAMHANTMGTNPRPQGVQTPTIADSLGYAVMAYFGF